MNNLAIFSQLDSRPAPFDFDHMLVLLHIRPFLSLTLSLSLDMSSFLKKLNRFLW